jgi:hypothetical protein
MATSAVDVHRWTREEYERLVDDGYFGPDERVELVVYREPRNGAYPSRTVLKAGDSVSPLACPEASLLVANFLP